MQDVVTYKNNEQCAVEAFVHLAVFTTVINMTYEHLYTTRFLMDFFLHQHEMMILFRLNGKLNAFW